MMDMLADGTMSNLTPNNNNRNDIASPSSSGPPAKKKRNLPGNPDPEAEVMALSPRTLMATNRFVCEICNKGFQRDQNLQLHRRGHNLPWKLKQRSNKEVMRKKVYVCPEATCVHHDPSRALGDLTGIKKHYCRKHGEKKWKCEKCSKRYAVQSDWKAHSKICGTREYRCDCGTLFSRRDSFITHRAFCDALAEENARSAITPNPFFSSLQAQQQQLHRHGGLQAFPLKREQQDRHEQLQQQSFVPPWLACSSSSIEARQGPPPNNDLPSSPLMFSTRMLDHENPNPNGHPTIPSFEPTPAALSHSPHMSATALLQKAAQIGVTMSHQQGTILRPHQVHMTATGLSSSRDREIPTGLMIHEGLASYGEKAIVTAGCMEQMRSTAEGSGGGGAPPLLHHHQNALSSLSSSTTAFRESIFEDTFNEMLNRKNDSDFQQDTLTKSSSAGSHLSRSREGGGGSGSGQEGLTRDFLGLKAFPRRDFMNMAASLDDQQNQNQPPWQN